ncbi:12275_t:CDS:2 [Acaulospora colombiana]|uniref:12275_t:CDS:1 n=1 Tax=Acaulospora colombiana TaxID=27376 RepID=A0ACA9L4R9_9GLOM|nr:12275_t:CDS:2 [Acaulospora colombiana]
MSFNRSVGEKSKLMIKNFKDIFRKKSFPGHRAVNENVNVNEQHNDSGKGVESDFEPVMEDERLESMKNKGVSESLMAALNKNTESIHQQSQRFSSLEVKIESIRSSHKSEASFDKNVFNKPVINRFDALEQHMNERFDYLEKMISEISKQLNATTVDSNFSTTTSDHGESPNNYICQGCRHPKIDEEWCSTCESQYFVSHYPDWTSGSTKVDNFIKATQRDASSKFDFLEWIPYESLKDVEHIGDGGFGTIYSATWINGPRSKWSHETGRWERYPNVKVALKRIKLDDFQYNTILFDELQYYLAAKKNVLGRICTLRVYGMTSDPNYPEKYMMVMLYADDGDLDKYIKENFLKLTYHKRLEILFDMITGILQIHEVGLVHRDLHRGNILCQRFIKLDEGRDEYRFVIGDLGLTRKPSSDSKAFYGVIPYCAPEILNAAKYSFASDIYSFGIIMWELVTGARAFSNCGHDDSLKDRIISGERPQLTTNIPESYRKLMERCWTPNPNDRPKAQEIYETIGVWLQKLISTPNDKISKEFQEADEKWLSRLRNEADERYHSKKIYCTENC